MAGPEKDVTKILTQRQVQLILNSLEQAKKSYERRINVETDQDAKTVWQTKQDELSVLASKIRLT